MPTKKVVKKKEKVVEKKTTEKEIEKKVAKDKGKYFYAVGRRKSAISRVKIFPTKNSQSSLTINERKIEDYFTISRMRDSAKAPLAQLGEGTTFDIEVNVYGGGVSAQADAVKLGIARALVIFDKGLKRTLKKEGYLTRDPREVERKKPGLKKARKSPQWAKR